MDAGDLRIFATVARLGAMGRAAAELHTVQSNVTARIRSLEKELGVALFRRHSRGVALTRAGERLLPYAAKVEFVLAEARRAVDDGQVPKGPLLLGSLETTAAQRLPAVIAVFGARFPEVDLSLATGTNLTLVKRVLGRELDGAFVCAPVHHPDLKGDPVFREELVLATARAVKSPDLLFTGPCRILVKGVGCAYRERLEALLARRGVAPVGRLEFGTLEAIVGSVAAGLGVTLLPRSVLATAYRQGRVRLHRLPAADAEVATWFVRRRDAFESGALRAFLACALEARSPGARTPCRQRPARRAGRPG